MTEGGLIPVFDGHNDSLLRLHQAAARGEPAGFRERLVLVPQEPVIFSANA